MLRRGGTGELSAGGPSGFGGAAAAAAALRAAPSQPANPDIAGPSTSGTATPSTAQQPYQSGAAAGTGDPLAPSPPPPLKLHPLTLSFADASLESAYAKHQTESQFAFDRSVHAYNVIIGLIHTGFSAHSVTGSLTSSAALWLVLPYLATSLAHWALSRIGAYARNRLPILLVLEAAYATVCLASMPKWVLVPATSWRVYLKDFVLGSGALISVWCARRSAPVVLGGWVGGGAWGVVEGGCMVLG